MLICLKLESMNCLSLVHTSKSMCKHKRKQKQMHSWRSKAWKHIAWKLLHTKHQAPKLKRKHKRHSRCRRGAHTKRKRLHTKLLHIKLQASKHKQLHPRRSSIAWKLLHTKRQRRNKQCTIVIYLVIILCLTISLLLSSSRLTAKPILPSLICPCKTVIIPNLCHFLIHAFTTDFLTFS